MKKIKNLKKAIEALESGKILQDEEGSIYFSDDKEMLENNECSYIYIDDLIESGIDNSEVFDVRNIRLPVEVANEYRFLTPGNSPVPQVMKVKTTEFLDCVDTGSLSLTIDPEINEFVLLMVVENDNTIDFKGVKIMVGIKEGSLFYKFNAVEFLPWIRFSTLNGWWIKKKFQSKIKDGVTHLNMPDFLAKKLLGDDYLVFDKEDIEYLAKDPKMLNRESVILIEGVESDDENLLKVSKQINSIKGIKILLPSNLSISA